MPLMFERGGIAPSPDSFSLTRFDTLPQAAHLESAVVSDSEWKGKAVKEPLSLQSKTAFQCFPQQLFPPEQSKDFWMPYICPHHKSKGGGLGFPNSSTTTFPWPTSPGFLWDSAD
jgi:hypothetical protein